MKPAFLVKLQNGRATVTQTHICLPDEPQVLGPDDLIDFEMDDRILILKVSDLDIILSANDRCERFVSEIETILNTKISAGAVDRLWNRALKQVWEDRK